MSGLRIGSLFSGYGGLDQAVTATLGGTVVWHSEYEPPSKAHPRPSQAAARLLAHHFPDVPNHGDISAIDWSAVEPVDILTGGFPCTDLSPAGLRLGLRPDTRSGLWTQMAYGIDRLRPRLVVIENVRGILSASAHCDLEPCPWCVGDDEGRPLRALGAVLGGLAELGGDARWVGLRAADVGAPHGRFRVFVTAWPSSHAGGPGLEGWRVGTLDASARGPRRESPPALGRAALTDSSSVGPWGTFTAAIRRWELIIGRAAPEPTDAKGANSRQLSPRFVEWLMGLDEGHVTAVPGLSRNDQLKVLGNGVVPQQAAAALRYMLPALSEQVAA